MLQGKGWEEGASRSWWGADPSRAVLGRARLSHVMGEDSIQASLGGISEAVSVTESFLPEFHLHFFSWGAFLCIPRQGICPLFSLFLELFVYQGCKLQLLILLVNGTFGLFLFWGALFKVFLIVSGF